MGTSLLSGAQSERGPRDQHAAFIPSHGLLLALPGLGAACTLNGLGLCPGKSRLRELPPLWVTAAGNQAVPRSKWVCQNAPRGTASRSAPDGVAIPAPVPRSISRPHWKGILSPRGSGAHFGLLPTQQWLPGDWMPHPCPLLHCRDRLCSQGLWKPVERGTPSTPAGLCPPLESQSFGLTVSPRGNLAGATGGSGFCSSGFLSVCSAGPAGSGREAEATTGGGRLKDKDSEHAGAGSRHHQNQVTGSLWEDRAVRVSGLSHRWAGVEGR